MFLVSKKRKARAHYWDGSDTKCRMASTGGLSMHRYSVTDDPGARLLCHMCVVMNGKALKVSPKEAIDIAVHCKSEEPAV